MPLLNWLPFLSVKIRLEAMAQALERRMNLY